MTTYVAPQWQAQNFHCPFCGVYSQQAWSEFIVENKTPRGIRIPPHAHVRCAHCHQISVWIDGKMVFPDSGLAPPPNDDMSNDVRQDYEEARGLVGRSPKAAAAILRLAIQRLMPHLGEQGKKIDDDIKSLVEKGLPARIQKALDVVRVIGNESVHPGTINVNDSPEMAYALFSLVNMIVDDRITQPKQLDQLYNSLPAEKIKAIERRDNKSP